MSKIMEHEATVLDVVADQKRVEVQMTVSGACAGCRAKEVCGNGESQERRISAYAQYPELYQVGQKVTVCIEQIMGIKAVVCAYVVPLVVMMVALMVANALGWAELYVGLTALGACALYYLVLFVFFRSRLEREIVFSIKKELF